MHSSQAAPPPQAPPAPASAPQLTFGSTPAPTSGPGTGVVALLLLMHCIAADALLCCCCCGSHCCCHCFVLLLLLVARWMHRASPLSCKSCLYSCLCCLRAKVVYRDTGALSVCMGFLMTLLHCGQSAYLHAGAAPQLCYFAPSVQTRDLVMYMTLLHSIKGSAQSPGVILGHVSF